MISSRLLYLAGEVGNTDRAVAAIYSSYGWWPVFSECRPSDEWYRAHRINPMGPGSIRRQYRRVSREEIQSWIMLYRQGASIYSIAKRYGRSTNLVQGILVRLGIHIKQRHPNKRKPRLTAIQKRQICRLQDRSAEEVARIFSVSVATVKRVWRGCKQ